MIRKLDIGCGNTITPGYERADADERCINLDMACTLDEVLAPDGTYDEVRASHCIEHVSIEGAERALREWFRILKPGGFIWVDTPHLDRNIDLYKSGDWMRDFATLTAGEKERCSYRGEPSAIRWINFKLFSTDTEYNTHYYNANVELLTQMCEDAGFERVEVLQTDPSLIVRAWKP